MDEFNYKMFFRGVFVFPSTISPQLEETDASRANDTTGFTKENNFYSSHVT